MLKKLTHFHYPKTIEEACKLLDRRKEKIAIIAGRTSENLKQNNNMEALVDPSKVKELNYIKKEATGFKIGALTPVQDIFKSKDLKGPAGELLKTAAGKIGSTLLRNLITIGGNVAEIFPWSDLPPVLLALDAEIVCKSGKPKRTIPVSTIIAERTVNVLKKNEIFSDILIPNFDKSTGTHFRKFAKTQNDYSMITIAIRITKAAGNIKEARIALNAVTATPVRCVKAEKMLEGKKASEALIEKVVAEAISEITISKDFRASKEYKQEVLGVLLKRGLADAIAKAGK